MPVSVTISWVEGPSAVHIGDEYLVYFDHYVSPQYYGAMRSKDMEHWEDISEMLKFPAGTRHGTVLPVPEAVLSKLK
jgi:hypothetical protein